MTGKSGGVRARRSLFVSSDLKLLAVELKY
jgi:hypothetical protein